MDNNIRNILIGAFAAASIFCIGRCSKTTEEITCKIESSENYIPKDSELPGLIKYSAERLNQLGNEEPLEQTISYLAKNGFENSMWENLDTNARARFAAKEFNNLTEEQQKYLARHLMQEEDNSFEKTTDFCIENGQKILRYLGGEEK